MKTRFSPPLGSACKQQFRGVTVGFLDVKSRSGDGFAPFAVSSMNVALQRHHHYCILMDLDCPGIRQTIPWGALSDVEGMIQQTWRVGRDGYLSCALLMHCKRG